MWEKYEAGMEFVTRWLNQLTLTLVLMNVVLIIVDVIGRYFFNRCVDGAHEIVQFSFMYAGLMTWGYCEMHGQLIRVDFVANLLPKKFMAYINVILTIVGIIAASMLGWRMCAKAILFLETGRRTTELFLPEWPFLFFASLIGISVFVLALLITLKNNIGEVIKKWLIIVGVLVAFVLVYTIWETKWIEVQNLNTIGALGILAFVLLVFLRMPVGLSMLTCGILGYWYVNSWSQMLVVLGQQPYRVLTQFTLTCLPPFILMGELALRTGMSTEAYELARRWLGHVRGGLAIATIGASALFACVTGSPLAVALTMVGVSLPEMRKAGYDDRLSFGTIATGALLGPMIPPSTTFVIYAFLTEVNLGYLLIGGIMPGIMMAILYIITVFIWVKINPSIATAGPKYKWKERLLSAPGVWAIAAVFAFVLWGIYAGIFSPTEAGAMGVFAVMVIGLIKRKLNWKGIWDSLRNAGRSTGMIVSVVTGAFVFNAFMASTRLPFNLADTISAWPVAPSVVMFVIIMVYVIAGFFMEVMAVVQMTVPILFPVVVGLGYDPVWFGVIIVLVVGLGQITPPYGMLVFSLQAYTRDVDTLTIFKGAWPFVYANAVALALLIFFPQIAYWLPYLGKRV